MASDKGSFGRIGEREKRHPNGMFKYNREHISYHDMFNRPRKEGDLFAIFIDDMGGVGVEYARIEDYDEFAYKQIERSMALDPRPISMEDLYILVGVTMINRIHDYDFENFIHLLDHELREIFDMRKLIEWTNMNKSMFTSPAEEAVMRDADDPLTLQDEMDSYKAAASGGAR